MQRIIIDIFENLVLFFFFLTVEAVRAVLWAARTVDEPDHDGPLLRLFCALVIGILSVVPRPVWTLVLCLAWLAWLPIKSILLVWGIGRESLKRSPKAVTRWYAHKRKRRATLLQRRERQDA